MSLFGAKQAEAGCFLDPVHPAHPMRPVRLWLPAWCNCLIWVWWQRRQYGGYAMHRRAQLWWRFRRHGPDRPAFFPHAMWSPDGETCFEYTTDKPDWVWWWQLPMFVLYRGRVQKVTRQWP